GLINSYTQAAPTATQGQRDFQVIRVPQYATATLTSGLTAAGWNGSTGGVLVFDVAGGLNLNGASVSVSQEGFRAGLGRALAGGAGGTGKIGRASCRERGELAVVEGASEDKWGCRPQAAPGGQ